eukprot:7645731-Pyramimonas_sp.AAC.1
MGTQQKDLVLLVSRDASRHSARRPLHLGQEAVLDAGHREISGVHAEQRLDGARGLHHAALRGAPLVGNAALFQADVLQVCHDLALLPSVLSRPGHQLPLAGLQPDSLWARRAR